MDTRRIAQVAGEVVELTILSLAAILAGVWLAVRVL